MANIPLLIVRNQHRWEHMHINANRLGEFHRTATRLCDPAAKVRYQEVQKATGVPWFMIAAWSEREYGGPPHWDKQLSQGDPLNRTSWHVPRGRGPFFNHPTDPPLQDAWYRGALDALIDCAPRAAHWHDWTPGGAATISEEYNGLGYANMGVPSAYVWSGSDQYDRGKYVRDGVYSPYVRDVQEGVMPLVSAMMAVDPTIEFASGPHATVASTFGYLQVTP